MAQSDMVSGTVILRDAVGTSVPSFPSIIEFSIPPSGMCRVVNFYVDPGTGKLVIEYDNVPVP